MKKLFIAFLFVSNAAYAEECVEASETEATNVVYSVDTSMPKHLKGAKITVTLADGKTSTVPAEKFMVVPRQQAIVVGQNKAVKTTVSCTKTVEAKAKKNLLYVDAKKEYTGIETETKLIPGGVMATVESRKEVVPALNYYRRDLIGSFGAGLGLDVKGQVKGSVGFDF